MAKSRFYNTAKWKERSRLFLLNNPLCIRCGQLSAVTDHVIPHNGDWQLFWDRENLQPLCKQCHDSYKQRLEKTGVVLGCDINGIPKDPNHHWNKT